MREQLELVEVYLRERFGKREDNYTKRLHSRISESVKHFAERGISAPSEADFEALRAWVSMKDGKPKGKPISAKTVSDWVSETVNFYNWLIHRRQINMFEDEEREGLQNEPETPAVSENTSTSEGGDTAILEDEAVEQEHTPITGTDVQDEPVDVEVQDEPDTLSLPVEAEPQEQPRRGRKPKPENADRVQITVYVRGSVYEGLKTLAQVKSLNISDIAAKAIDRVVEQNSQTIAIAQQALRNLAALNVEI